MSYSNSYDLVKTNLNPNDYLPAVSNQVKKELGLEVKAVDLGELFFDDED